MKRLTVIPVALTMILIIVVLSVSFSSLSCFDGSDKPIVLNMGDTDPSPKFEISGAMAERFNQRAGGRYIIEVYHTSELLQTPDFSGAVKTGAIDICAIPLGMFGDIDPRLAAAETPFLFDSIHAYEAAQEQLRLLYNTFLEEEYNQKAIAFFPYPGLDVCSAREPIRVLEDWQGLLVQSISPMTEVVIKVFGGEPVFLQYDEAYIALQEGLVDVTIESCGFIKDYGLYNVADYVTVPDMIFGSVMVNINLDVWNSLPADIQDILLEESQTLMLEKAEAHIREYEDGPQILADEYGMEVYFLDEAERDRWRETLRPFTEEILADLGDFGQDLWRIAEEVNNQFSH